MIRACQAILVDGRDKPEINREAESKDYAHKVSEGERNSTRNLIEAIKVTFCPSV